MSFWTLSGQRSYAETMSLIAAADVLAMPSRNEGFGLALLEAMALSTPVVASDIAVFRELGGEPSVVRLFEPGNATALANAVCAVLTDHASARHQAALAREHFVNNFSHTTMLGAYRSLYAEISSRPQ